jgi:hypothetical protein
MAIDILFGFDSTDAQDQQWIQRLQRYKETRATGVPIGLVRRVKRSGVGSTFVEPLARQMTANQPYTAVQLAGMLGQGWTAKRVASKLNVLGKPEKRYSARIFARPQPGSYALTQQMKDALLDPNN